MVVESNKMVSIICQFCHQPFECLTLDDEYWLSHESCRDDYYKVNEDLSSFFTDKINSNDLFILSAIYSHNKVSLPYYSWINNTILFRSILKHYSLTKYYFIEVDLIPDELSGLFKVEKILTNEYYFDYIRNLLNRNQIVLPIIKNSFIRCQYCKGAYDDSISVDDHILSSHASCRKINEENNSNFSQYLNNLSNKSLFPCQFCNKVFDLNNSPEEDDTWESHTACRANLIDINNNLESFFKDIVDIDKTLLLKIREYTTAGDDNDYFLPFYLWDKEKIIFGFPDNSGRNNPGKLHVYLNKNDSGQFSIKKIEYDSYFFTKKAIKKLVNDLNRNIPLQRIRDD